MATAIDSATSFMSQVGRHFSITSLLPTLVLLVWLLALFSSPPWTNPDTVAIAAALTEWTIGKVVTVVALAITIGFVVHPLIFGTTQLLEGYWGTHRVALRAAATRAHLHRRRQIELRDVQVTHGDRVSAFTTREFRKLWSAEELAEATAEDIELARRAVLGGAQGLPIFGDYLAHQAASRAMAAFPEEGERMMPTRLGNALRRVEDRTGRQFGLDIMVVAPHLAVVADARRATYINDSREELDLAVRLCSYALITAVVTTVWLTPTGWWLLAAGAPYCVGYAAYRGAIAAAQEWGAALGAAVDVDRFALYGALHMPLPRDTDEERRSNRAILELLNGSANVSIQYVHPQ